MTYPVDTEVITYKRRKVKGKRQVLLSQFKAEEVHHRLEDCTCPDCHGELKEIGASLQRQELVFIPAQLKRLDHVQHAYKCLKYEETFKTILKDGNLVLSNNRAERAIKSLVMGRKNWLFSQSFEGAKATAIIMSLLETAKRHGLDSEKYITYLLTHLSNEETLAKREVLEAYLPWAEVVQENCK